MTPFLNEVRHVAGARHVDAHVSLSETGRDVRQCCSEKVLACAVALEEAIAAELASDHDLKIETRPIADAPKVEEVIEAGE